ncbi:Oligopeptide transport ATP-binding protein OppF (TC 3.A.1.5.1) [[Actinomadura] parvosata subsp. kistnae]|uniref:Glutathione import ATP-binding protein GsiA n=1 Tax=[Actinomadura] parvosata subsp. kistnae TaxID=1909395 RepID=A0A1U9ZUY1_9ACTN|nr:ABC transporter ATP-binding protein [Nonomuraea sp. ATCC 55076]AQZ61761.1 ABC transporter ATP-binding protein [Nonomuraea sp. ATCC 55076]SPL87877.1 Oligopeptide transport ATP-binding protein OppF (TC 3.A.1.5.1) [Actinomadura parvosata subsp. kistnae]
MTSLLTIDDLVVEHRSPGRPVVRAVAGASLTVRPGEVVGLVGESGCGKSTLARAVCGLNPVTAGSIDFDGQPVTPLGLRRRKLTGIQMVFQDPYASLNPRRRVGDQIADGLRTARDTATSPADLLERVGLPREFAGRHPHEFSGGQRQRIAIARALAARPRLLIGDEPISALDASAQAQVARLMRDLAVESGAGLLFISHDLSVVRLIADRIAVMYLGKIVEVGDTAEVWANPRHPYTRALLAAIPQPDGLGVLPEELPGDVPDPASPPSGCRFNPRCPLVMDVCRDKEPDFGPVACWLHEPK